MKGLCSTFLYSFVWEVIYSLQLVVSIRVFCNLEKNVIRDCFLRTSGQLQPLISVFVPYLLWVRLWSQYFTHWLPQGLHILQVFIELAVHELKNNNPFGLLPWKMWSQFWMLSKISLLRWQMSHETYCQKYRAQNIVPLNILSSWNVPQKVWTLNQSVHLSTKHHSSNEKSSLQNLSMMAALMKFHNFSEPQKTIISCVWRHKSTSYFNHVLAQDSRLLTLWWEFHCNLSSSLYSCLTVRCIVSDCSSQIWVIEESSNPELKRQSWLCGISQHIRKGFQKYSWSICACVPFYFHSRTEFFYYMAEIIGQFVVSSTWRLSIWETSSICSQRMKWLTDQYKQW